MAEPEKIGLAAVLEMEQFSKGVKAYDKGLDGMEKKTGGVARKLSKLMGGIGKGLLGVGKIAAGALAGGALAGAAAIGGLGVAFAKLAMDAAPLQGIKSAFEGITEASGVSSDVMLAAFKKQSAGMITNADAMEAYNSAAQLVGTTFANQLPDAMGFLGKVSAATGEDMSFMMDSLVKGIGRLSPMILDNLGIQVDLVKANEDYAAEMGLVVGEMTKTEQQAALMAQTMALLEENTANMPEVTGSAAASMAELKATMQDTKDSIGLALLPAFQTIMGTISELVQRVLPPLVAGFEKHVIPIVDKVAKWLGEKLPLAFEKARGAIRFVVDGIAEFKRKFSEAVSGGVEPLRAAVGRFLGIFVDPIIGEDATEPFFNFFLRAHEIVTSTFGTIQDALGRFQRVFKWTTEQGLNPFQAAFQGLITILDEFAPDDFLPAEITDRIGDFIDAVTAMSEVIGGTVTEAISEFQRGFQASIEQGISPFESAINGIMEVLDDFLSEDVLERIWGIVDWGKAAVIWIGEKVPLALQAIKDAFDEDIVPAVRTAIDWLGEKLPIAFAAIKTFVDETLVPAIETAVLWLGEKLPQAFEVLKNDIIPFLEKNAKPILAALGTVAAIAFGAWAWGVASAAAATIAGAAATALALAPVILIVGAIAAVVGLLVAAWDNDWGGMQTKLKAFWEETAKPIFESVKKWLAEDFPVILENVKTWFITAWENISTGVSAAWDKAVAVFESVKEWFTVTMPQAVKAGWEKIKSTVTSALSAVISFVVGKIETFRKNWADAWDAVASFVAKAWETIKLVALTALILLLDHLGLNLEKFLGEWKAGWTAIKDWVATAWENIKEFVVAGAAAMLTVAKEKLTELKEDWETAWGIISTFAETAWTNIKEFVVAGATAILQVATDKMAELKEDWETAWGIISGFAATVWETIKTTVTEAWDDILLIIQGFSQPVKDAIEKPINDAWQAIKDKVSEWVQIGKDLIQGLIDGIKAMGEKLISSITGGIGDALNRAKALLGIGSPSKVFFQIGIDLMEGFLLGVQAHTAKVLGEFKNIFGEFSRIFNIASLYEGVGGGALRALQFFTLDPLEKGLTDSEAEAKALEDELEAVQERLDEIRGLNTLVFEREFLMLMDRELEIAELIAAEKEKQAGLTADIAEQEAKITRFREAQEKLAWLQQQIDLLNLIRTHGLDPEAVLGGISLGEGTSAAQILEAMTRALNLVIAQTQSHLATGAGGEIITQGAGGQQRTGSFARQSVTVPAGGATTNTVNVNLGGVTINDQMDLSSFEGWLHQTVAGAMA